MKLNTVCNEIEPNVIVECVSWRLKLDKDEIKKKFEKVVDTDVEIWY